MNEEGIGIGFYYSLTNNFYLNVKNHVAHASKDVLRGQYNVSQSQYESIALGHLEELWSQYPNLTEIWFDGGYTSDITRTWPLSGRFNDLPRRLVYEAVLDVQQTLIKALQQNEASDESNVPWTVDGLYHEMQKLFRPHLINLGLIDENAEVAVSNV